MKNTINGVVLAVSIISIIFSSTEALARFRFEEGDWIAWGDARNVKDFNIGKRTIYFATSAGVLRWDRDSRNWLAPWYSVPGPLDEAIILDNCSYVREDEQTMSVYVMSKGQWFVREPTSRRWDKTEAPSGELAERLKIDNYKGIDLPHGLITPFKYLITQNKELEYSFVKWPYAGGIHDGFRGYNYFAWTGYGIGMNSDYNQTLKLFPGGPGPSPSMDIVGDDIWCVSKLNRENGWIWHRDRNKDSWEFFHPDIEYSLQPAKINRLRVGNDGTVWLATSEGVMYRKGNNWRWLKKQDGLPARIINDIVPVGENAWAVSNFGGSFIEASSGVVINESASRFSALDYDESTGILYLADAGHIYHYTKETGMKFFSIPPTVSVADRPNVLYAKDGIIAVGDKRGVAWREKEGKWKEVLAERWFGGDVLSIAFHGGYIWLGTTSGLVKFDPKEGDAIKYTSKEGLVGRSVHEIIPEGDYLWLGTDKALVMFKWYDTHRLD